MTSTKVTTTGVSWLVVGLMAVSLAACNRTTESTGAAAPKTSVGTEIDDTIVTGSVKSALLGDANVKSLELSVETRKGEVMLSGFVESQAQVERATAVTRGVAGVKSVDNKLAVKTGSASIGNKVDDGIVSTRVKAALLADSSVKGSDINVDTRQGEVQLSGFVDNSTQMDRAVQLARAVDGVEGVDNEMVLKR